MTTEQQTVCTLHNLLDYDAKKFTSAEILLQRHLPDWILHADSLKLKTVLQKYLGFVEQHVKMLEGFFESEQISSISTSNRVMQAFIDEAAAKMAVCADAAIKDACLLASIQAINHFKISMYGTAAAFAKALGMEEQAAIFYKAEVEEKQIDDRLSQLAEHEVNIHAKTPVVLPG
ncbi:ferritin-like domain-containing protein [Flavihumibacter fluvii]|uniref:YciE/YciF ferroxidase family protein n=1 Tax=Flavihumibacter fluvii TaxID=2838157 RepID=UPI001BDEB167|nr:DUF892 family protein [Flavihumibacter fluvii]ULQ53318.1 DUF892 family protein [Flavihumibacter fluvii]